MNLKELEASTGMPARQIRYLIEIGAVPRPRGTRHSPEYGDDHENAILHSMTLKTSGVQVTALSPTSASKPITFAPMPGVVLAIDSTCLPEGFDRNDLAEQFTTLFHQHMSHLIKEPKQNADRTQE